MRCCRGSLVLVMGPMRDGELPVPGLSDGADRQRADAIAGGDASINGEEAPRAAGPARPDDALHVLSAVRYLAWLYSPAFQQPVLAKLCEIESEIAGSVRAGLDHHVAHARLQWWSEECERCAQGRPVHPLTRELVKAYGAVPAGRPSPLAGISGFVDTAVWDLAGATFETRKELTAYCERWAAAMFETAAGQRAASEAHSGEDAHATRATQVARMMPAPGATTSAAESMAANSRASAAESSRASAAANSGAGAAANTAESDPSPYVMANAAAAGTAASAATSPEAGAAANSGAPDQAEPAPREGSRWRVLGAAVREIELLANLAREAHVGRLRVPLDELERAGVDVKSLATPPWPAPLVALLRERHEALRATVGECVGALGREQQAEFRGLLVWAALARKQSVRAQRALPNTISPRRYHAFADGWLAWSAARRAAAGNLRLS